MIDDDYRIEYYLDRGPETYNAHSADTTSIDANIYYHVTRNSLYNSYVNKKYSVAEGYLTDLIAAYNLLPASYHVKSVFLYPGDVSHKLDHNCIAKCKLINNNNTILNLDRTRHYDLNGSVNSRNTQTSTIDYINSVDIKFKQKKSSVVYRGSNEPFDNYFRWKISRPRGKPRRYDLFRKWSAHESCNIGTSQMSVEEMLQYRYIISVEGNDVASNLKWAMLSNSVVMMPRPTVCSWFMEDHLVPYKHYIPIKSNFKDIEKQFKWCEKNVDQCEYISNESTNYTQKFYNTANERKLSSLVLKRYIDRYD